MNINEADENGVTPLMRACCNGMDDIVETLIKFGADVNAVDKDGNTALLYSVVCKYVPENILDIFQLLIQAGADINHKDSDGRSALFAASRREGGRFDIFEWLIEKGCDLNINAKDGSSPILAAARSGNVEVMKKLLSFEPSFDINAALDVGCQTALWVSVGDGHIDMVRYLVSIGADVNSKEDKNNKNDETGSPVFLASNKRNLEMCQLLVECGASIYDYYDEKNIFESIFGNIAPMIKKVVYNEALDLEVRDLCQFFIAQGADSNVDCKMMHNIKPVAMAATVGFAHTVRLFIEHGANVNYVKDGLSLLIYACFSGSTETAKVLVELGANIEYRAADSGRTAFLISCQHGSLELVKYLYEKGANIHAVSRDKSGALIFASENKQKGIVEFLLEIGNKTLH